MRIEPSRNVAPTENSSRKTAAGTTAKASGAADPKAPAEKRTSNTAEFLSAQSRAAALAALVNQLPEVRQEKVAAIAHAVRRGTYQVSPEQTAGAIISDLDASNRDAA